MAVLVALACAVVLMLSGIIPVFGRSTTVDRTQTPVLQRIAKLNQFTAATGTFQVIVDIEDDVGGLPSILAGERTLMVASGEVEAEVLGELAHRWLGQGSGALPGQRLYLW